MTIGEKIKLQRKQFGLTQTELGEKLGVKTNAVSKWECGRVEDIPTSKIKAMASLFNVRPSYFIDDTAALMDAVRDDIKSGRAAARDGMFKAYGEEGSCLTTWLVGKKCALLYYQTFDDAFDNSQVSAIIDELSKLSSDDLIAIRGMISGYLSRNDRDY